MNKVISCYLSEISLAFNSADEHSYHPKISAKNVDKIQIFFLKV